MKKLIVIIFVLLSLSGYSQGIKAGLTGNSKLEPNYTVGLFYIHNFGKIKVSASVDYVGHNITSQGTDINGEAVIFKSVDNYFSSPVSIGFGENVYLFTGIVPRYRNFTLGFQFGLGSYVKFQKTFVNLEAKATYDKNLMLFFTIGYGLNLQR